MLVMSPLPRFVRVAFWTLCACAYILAVWCTAVLLFDIHLLPFAPVIHDWPKEADFTSALCFLASVALVPFVVYLRRSRLCVWVGLGVWGFQVLWFFAFPVF